MTSTPGSDPVDDLLEAAAVDDAIRRRRAERDVRDRSRELATWSGTLRDLAERAVPVTVTTSAASTHRGVVLVVAADHVVIRAGDGALAAVATAVVVAVRADPSSVPGRGVADGRRSPASEARLVEVLDRWREDVAECVVLLTSGDRELGRLGAVGTDVVTVRTSAGTVHVPLAAVAAVTVR